MIDMTGQKRSLGNRNFSPSINAQKIFRMVSYKRHKFAKLGKTNQYFLGPGLSRAIEIID